MTGLAERWVGSPRCLSRLMRGLAPDTCVGRFSDERPRPTVLTRIASTDQPAPRNDGWLYISIGGAPRWCLSLPYAANVSGVIPQHKHGGVRCGPDHGYMSNDYPKAFTAVMSEVPPTLPQSRCRGVCMNQTGKLCEPSGRRALPTGHPLAG